MEQNDLFKRIGRIVIRPDKEGKDEKLILGCSFDAGILKPGFVYEIQQVLGQIVIREVGESSCRYSRNESKSNYSIAWCNDANEIIQNGTHLLTEKEYLENIHDSRNEEEKINDTRKENLDDILDGKGTKNFNFI